VAVIGANITPENVDIVYAVPPDGANASDFVVPLKLEALPFGGRYIFRSSDGVAQDITLAQDIDEYEFTPGGGASQLIIAAQGAAINFIIPAAITQYVSGGGFSGTGEIELIAISALWSLKDADKDGTFYPPTHVFDSTVLDSLTLSGTTITELAALDDVGGNILTGGSALSLTPVTGAKATTYNATDKTIEFAGTAATGETAISNHSVLEFSSTLSHRVMAFVFTGVNNVGANQHAFIGRTDGAICEGLRIGNERIRFFVSSYRDNIRTIWNGEIAGSSGSETPEWGTANRDRYYLNDSGASFPEGEPYILFIDFGSTLTEAEVVGAAGGSGTDWNRSANLSLTRIIIWDDLPSDDYMIRAQQRLAWDEFNRNSGNGLLLPDTGEGDLGLKHPYHDEQLANAGGTSAVSGESPATTVTFEATPLLNGAEISIRWSNTNNQILRHRVVGDTYDWVPDTVPQRVDIDVNLAGYQPWRVRDRLITESVTLFVELRESTAWEAET
jgi:hypothetical protein